MPSRPLPDLDSLQFEFPVDATPRSGRYSQEIGRLASDSVRRDLVTMSLPPSNLFDNFVSTWDGSSERMGHQVITWIESRTTYV